MIDGSLVILILYVDDILFVGYNTYHIDVLIQRLSDSFDIQGLGKATHVDCPRQVSKDCTFVIV